MAGGTSEENQLPIPPVFGIRDQQREERVRKLPSPHGAHKYSSGLRSLLWAHVMPPPLLAISKAVELHLERLVERQGSLDQSMRGMRSCHSNLNPCHFLAEFPLGWSMLDREWGPGNPCFLSLKLLPQVLYVRLAKQRCLWHSLTSGYLSDTYFRRASCLCADLVGRLPPRVRDVNVCLCF